VLVDYVIPYSNVQTDRLKAVVIQQGHLPYGQKSFMFKEFDDSHNLKQLIFIGNASGRQLTDCTIFDLTRPGVMQIIQARKGEWFANRWDFQNANAYTVSQTADVLVFNHIDRFSLFQALAPNSDMLKRINNEDDPMSVDANTSSFAKIWRGLKRREQAGLHNLRITYIKMWERITLPLSCLVIVLTALPLAITDPRKSADRGFIFAIGVLFLYYLLRSVSVAIGRSGTLTFGGAVPLDVSLFLAAWLPVILIALLGLGLIMRKSKVL
jgi:lipopolysaccharide export LptBFGC system permease protein LptF